MTLEDEFRAALARSAEAVVPEPRPLDRLYRRRTRQRRRRYAATGAALVALIAAIGFANPFSLGYEAQPADGYDTTTWSRRLIESPTRGSLAGDAAYVRELTERLDGDRGSLGVSGSLDRMRLLFVGDAGTARVAIVVFHDDDTAAMYYREAPRGASVDELASGGGGGNMQVQPLVVVGGDVQNNTGGYQYSVAVAPDGCVIDTSTDGRVNAAGEVVRTWTTGDPSGVLVGDRMRITQRWRVTCDGAPRYEGPAWPVHEVEAVDGPLATLRPAAGFGATAAEGRSWNGDVAGDPATLTVATTTEGGALVALAVGGEGKSLVAGAGAGVPVGPSDDPTMAKSRQDWGLVATAAVPSADFVVVRIPQRSGSRAVFTDRMLVIAPAGAVGVAVGVSGTRLALRAGMVLADIPWPAQDVQITALDASGAKVASMTIRETGAWSLFGEPVTWNW